jgi:hypothetical protein
VFCKIFFSNKFNSIWTTCLSTNGTGYEGKIDLLSQINQIYERQKFTTELKITIIVDCEKQKINKIKQIKHAKLKKW